MLTLDSILRIPDSILFTPVDEEAVLLNTCTNRYFSLDDVGARVWSLLGEGKILREIHQTLLEEFDVEAAQLERDLLELATQLLENGLVEPSAGSGAAGA
jgi:hypothetical protein